MSQEVTLSLVWNDNLHGARKFQPHMPAFFPIWSRNPIKEPNRKAMIRRRCFKHGQETGQETLLFLSSLWLLKARGSHDLPGTQDLWPSFLLTTLHSYLQPRWRHSRQLLFVGDGVSHGVGYKLKLACLIRENASFSCPEGALCSHCSQDSDPSWGSAVRRLVPGNYLSLEKVIPFQPPRQALHI